MLHDAPPGASTGIAKGRSLLWLSPFGPNSDIGAFSRAVLHSLERRLAAPFSNLELVIEPNGASYRPHVPFRWIEGLSPAPDALCVFNIGNDKNNHQQIGRLAMAHSGLVVLHDVVLHDFMVWHYLQHAQDRCSYAAELALEGGLDLARLAMAEFLPRKDRPPGRAWEREPLRSRPMLSSLLGHARGVVVHSRFAAGIARRYTKAPILPLFLPSDQKRLYSQGNIAKWQERTRTAAPLTVTSFGNLSRNKCMESIIRAFAGSDRLRRGARLRIAGYPRDNGYVDELRALACELGLSGQVELHPAVDERKLARIKDETDVFVLLRRPNIEGASGALTEALNTGRPVVVMASGAFDELPDAVCRKISPLDDGTELARVLEELVADPAQRIALGAAGHAHQQRFNADGYAAAFLDFARDVADTPPRRAPGGPLGALARLAGTEPPRVIAEIICRSELRRPAGSRIEAAFGASLERGDVSERLVLLRSFLDLVQYLDGRRAVPPSHRSLAALAEVVLAFGPTAFVELLWPSLVAANPGLTRADAILGFRLDGPAIWPDDLPRPNKAALGTDLLALRPGEDLATTDREPGWSGQFAAGWHRPEATGTWTNGRHVVLPIARPAGTVGPSRLSVAMNNFGGRPCDEPIASVDGEAVPVTIRRQDRLRIAEILLPDPLDPRGWLVVLDVGDARRPSEERESRDARLLGAKIAWLRLETAAVSGFAAG